MSEGRRNLLFELWDIGEDPKLTKKVRAAAMVVWDHIVREMEKEREKK